MEVSLIDYLKLIKGLLGAYFSTENSRQETKKALSRRSANQVGEYLDFTAEVTTSFD